MKNGKPIYHKVRCIIGLFCVKSLNIGRYDLARAFPSGSDGKEPACNVEDLGSIPGSGRYSPTPVFLPGKFHGQRDLADYILQKVSYS